jgi:hypothetical protein
LSAPDRQVGRLLAFENPSHIPSRLSILFGDIGPIADQAATGDLKTVRIDRGQFMPGREVDEHVAARRGADV